MKCEEYLELISMYLDRDLDPKDAEDLEEHLSLCKNCMAIFHTLEKTILLSYNYYRKKYCRVPKKVSARVFYELRIRYEKQRF